MLFSVIMVKLYFTRKCAQACIRCGTFGRSLRPDIQSLALVGCGGSGIITLYAVYVGGYLLVWVVVIL